MAVSKSVDIDVEGTIVRLIVLFSIYPLLFLAADLLVLDSVPLIMLSTAYIENAEKGYHFASSNSYNPLEFVWLKMGFNSSLKQSCSSIDSI